MKVINLAETNSILNQFIAELCECSERQDAFSQKYRENRRINGLRNQ